MRLSLQTREIYKTKCCTFTVIQSKSFTSVQEEDGAQQSFSKHFTEFLGAKFSRRWIESVVQFCVHLRALI
jgi:hypothetical protein